MKEQRVKECFYYEQGKITVKRDYRKVFQYRVLNTERTFQKTSKSIFAVI